MSKLLEQRQHTVVNMIYNLKPPTSEGASRNPDFPPSINPQNGNAALTGLKSKAFSNSFERTRFGR